VSRRVFAVRSDQLLVRWLSQVHRCAE